MKRFEATELGLGLKRIKSLALSDARGSLTRLFCSEELTALGWQKPISQINWVETKSRGTLRGMHYQKAPCAEDKILLCMSGEIYDVAVDVRRDSTSLLQHVANDLSALQGDGLFIPAGFAHGYQCMTDDVKLIYFHSVAHTPSAECGLNPLDPLLQIAWPLAPQNISERDQNHNFLTTNFAGDLF